MATPVLFHIQVSHYNEKVRWALDHKGIPHVRKAPFPMLHTAWAFAMTRGATFPVLKMDGTTIGDSTRIIEALERSHPESALYPDEPAPCARALELEEFFDEELAPHIRRALFAEVTRDSEAFAWAAAPTAGRVLEAELGGRDYLVGDRFTVADLTAAALFFPIVRPAEAQYQAPGPLPEAVVARREALASRPGFQWVQEMYRRHRGKSAEVPA